MSSWGCETGHWYDDTCTTTPGATFSEPITFTIYANDGGALGGPVATDTETFSIPFRPSKDDVKCTGSEAGKWYDATESKCYNGFATPITFDFSAQNITLPASVIYGISYNTSHYGPNPYGESPPSGCYTSGAGCGYDSLNVAVGSPSPRVGIDDDQAGVFQNSSWSGAYCDNGVDGTGTFRLDTGCWTGNNPNVRFHVEAPNDPTNLKQFKPNGQEVASGDSTNGEGLNNKRSVTLQADVSDPDAESSVSLEVEVQCADCATPVDFTKQSNDSAPGTGGTLSVTVNHADNNGNGLDANHDYVWRARAVDENGFESSWVNFDNFGSAAGFDFRVPQADLSLTKSVLGSSGLTPGDHVNIAANAADLTATHTHTLIVTLAVSNAGPDMAKNTVVTDDVLSIMDNAPTPHQVLDSATYCVLNNAGKCVDPPTTLPAGGKISAGDLASGDSEKFQIFGNVNWQVRRGPVTLTNNAIAESDVYSSTSGQASKQFTVNTIPKFDVQPGSGNTVVSWSPPPLADEAAVHHYRLKITGGPSPITVDPVPTTACTGRNGGTLCYNATGLTNGTNYNFQLFAVTATSVLRDGSEGQGKPSVDNKAAIIPATTASSFTTCTAATVQHPICVTTQVPSGGGGVFSVQNAISGYSSFQFSNFCGGSACGQNLGSFEGHPPTGYNDPTHPIVIIATWDKTAWDGVHQDTIYYQADTLPANARHAQGAVFQLPKCGDFGNPSVDTTYPDPCLKKTNVLGNSKKDNCGVKAACFGDLQAQILLTSAADGGFAKKG